MNILTLKSTIRQFSKNKLFSSLNVLGLAIGLSSFLILQYYISFERDYESFIPEKEQVYRINFSEYQHDERLLHSAKAHSRLAVLLTQEVAEVEYACYSLEELNAIKYNDKNYNGQKTLWVAGDFTEIVGLHIIAGESKLKDPYTCLVSESWAKDVFNDDDPVGKELLVNGAMQMFITGVYKDLPSNTHFDFDNLMSIQTWDAYGWIPAEGNWEWPGWWNYIKLKKGVNPGLVEQKINQMGNKYLSQYQNGDRSFKYHIQPISELHFANDLRGEIGISTRKSTLLNLRFISLLVLVIALVNFINIETALINKSQHYFANLKKIGATKQSLIATSFIRSAAISTMAVAISFLLFKVLSTYFGNKLQIPFKTGAFSMNSAWLLYVFVVAGIVLLATLFSTIAIAKVSLVEIKNPASYKQPLTRLLVGAQFTIAIVLMVTSVMVIKQVHFMQTANLGISLDKVICLKGSAATNGNVKRGSVYKSFSSQVLNLPEVQSATYSHKVPGQSIELLSTDLRQVRKPSDHAGEFQFINADNGFITTFNVDLIAGRNFATTYKKDSNNVLLSKLAVEALGFANASDAIDKEVVQGGKRLRIIGVIENFHHEGLKSQLQPMLILNRHPEEFGYAMLKLNTINAKTIAAIKEVWEQHYPDDQFQYFYNGAFFKKQYNSDVRFAKIIIGFTLLAIFVALFGLFGMVTFVVQERIKEIGVRKVNGATVVEVLKLINKDFLIWVGIAFSLASPIAFYACTNWLKSYAYKTNISWWVFALSGLAAMLVTAITVSWLSFKTARRNPAQALRYE